MNHHRPNQPDDEDTSSNLAGNVRSSEIFDSDHAYDATTATATTTAATSMGANTRDEKKRKIDHNGHHFATDKLRVAPDTSYVQQQQQAGSKSSNQQQQEVSAARQQQQQIAINEILSLQQQQSAGMGGMMGGVVGNNNSIISQNNNLQQLFSLQNNPAAFAAAAAAAASSSGMQQQQGDNRSAAGGGGSFSSMFCGGPPPLGNNIQHQTAMQSQLAAWRQTFPSNSLLQQGLGMSSPQQLLQGHGGGGGFQQGIGAGGQSLNNSGLVGGNSSPHLQSLRGNHIALPTPGSDFGVLGGGGVGGREQESKATEEENLRRTGRRPITLYMSCDEESLSEYQCLVRRQVDLFEARREEVDSNAKGRNKPIVLGQVGIRCRHCSMLPPKHRTRGAMYYPAKLNGLYQAAQSMASGHLCYHCQHIPDEIRQDLLVLRERKSSAGGGKKYWADGVRVLGVYEDEDGLRFKNKG